MSGANSSVTLLASAARTATVTKEARNLHHRGILIVVDVTAVSLTPAVTPSITVKDEAGNYDTTIWTAAAAIGATGQFSYLIYPGAVSADFDGTEAVGLALPQEWTLSMAHGDTDSITYSVRGHYIV